MIGIIDYGICNIKSVALAVEEVSAKEDVVVSNDPKLLINAEKLILPGVCSYSACMDGLKRYKLDDLIKSRVVNDNVPILGICIGLHVLSTAGFEFGETKGLNLIPGFVKPIEAYHVPHMGWNQCKSIKNSTVFGKETEYYYFAHSYHYVPDDLSVVSLMTIFGLEVVAAIEYNNIFGCQFHPERSGNKGLEIISNFINNHNNNMKKVPKFDSIIKKGG